MIDNFQTKSIQIQNIMKSFQLTKSLFVSSILIGQRSTGKKSLIRHLFPNAIFADGSDQESTEQLLEENDELVIFNYEKLANAERLNFDNKRIIAVANYISNEKSIDTLFAFIYHMPPLKDREEDVALLVDSFLKEAKKNLMIKDTISIEYKNLDISSNIESLKRSVYQQALSQSCTDKDIEVILYHYLYKQMGGGSDYKKFLPLYEKPLIEAGLKKYGSQLKLSDILGINRNTLRKKIYELSIS